MDTKYIKKITHSVIKQFPEMKGHPPRVERNNGYQAKSTSTSSTFLLTYSAVATNPNGQKIPRRVRVVASAKGHILKISTSR